MIEAEEIRGKNRVDILRQLVDDRTLVQVQLPGKDYERLTVITGVKDMIGKPSFSIDYPEGFEEAVSGMQEWKLRFQFTGKDRLQYVFRTTGGRLSKGRIWIVFPRVVERRQRRRHFRLDVPPGTKLLLTVGSARCEMRVENVSIGGALGPLVCIEDMEEDGPLLRSGETLSHILLEFPSRGKKLKVHVKEASVIRWEQVNGKRDEYRYALQFKDMGTKEERTLAALIYKFQREYLRKRLPLTR